ncbi:STAS domain-containing protein [Neobacillus sp. 114]|uniref:STAS domain-containing protein n=1 Tax=Neobacillus sp. 114 TaxID=3048535 RepID=UPI0024C23E3E|nr:STAS domain-containing protein [Neobacillus sp. 114]
MFKFSADEINDKLFIKLEGALDIEATEIIENELVNEISRTDKMIEFDFRKIDFVDSSGIGLLITLIEQLKESRRNPKIINVKEDVQQIFELIQLDQILGQGVLV